MRTNKLQRIWKPFYLLSLLTAGFLLLHQPVSEGYIAKRYSVQKIVSESSNVLFGTVSEVNTKRRTAKIRVEKYLKGKAEFSEIRIRLDVYKGEKDHRDEAMRLLKQDDPVIVFYLKEGGRIDSLVHASGKWFQTQTTRQGGNWGWWLFTHTEKIPQQRRSLKARFYCRFSERIRCHVRRGCHPYPFSQDRQL